MLNLLLWIVVSCYQVYLSFEKGKLPFLISFFLVLIGVIGLVTPLNTFLYVNLSMILQVLSIIILLFNRRKKKNNT